MLREDLLDEHALMFDAVPICLVPLLPLTASAVGTLQVTDSLFFVFL